LSLSLKFLFTVFIIIIIIIIIKLDGRIISEIIFSEINRLLMHLDLIVWQDNW